MTPLPAPLGAEEAERGSSELVTAAAGSVSLGAAAAAAQTLCGSSCRRFNPGLCLGLSAAAPGCPGAQPGCPAVTAALQGRAGPGGAAAQPPPRKRNALN